MDATGPFETMLGQYREEIGKQNLEAGMRARRVRAIGWLHRAPL